MKTTMNDLRWLASLIFKVMGTFITPLPTTSTVESAFPLSAPPVIASADPVFQPPLLVQLVTLMTKQKEFTHYCNISFPTTEPTFAK